MDFDTAIKNWVNLLQDMWKEYFAKHYTNLQPPKVELQPGSKFIKVIMADNSQRSVYCFIDKSNGNILKPAGWKAPEPKRIPRGNIFGDNPLEGCNVHSVAYLR
jgi:hypothetical protein